MRCFEILKILSVLFLCLPRTIFINGLPVGKNITLTQLFSVGLQDISDVADGVTRDYKGMGISAQLTSASLGPIATLFRLHRPGFQHVPNSVSLESNSQPGLFLRHKNYKFHLEKAKPTGLFEKDSTFLERNPIGPHSMALELFIHPGWFICHETASPFILQAASKVVGSKEFDEKCMFRLVVRKYHSNVSQKPKQSQNEKETEAAKAAEILDDLVAKETVGEILTTKPKDSVALSQPKKTNNQSHVPSNYHPGPQIVHPGPPKPAMINSLIKTRPLVPQQKFQIKKPYGFSWPGSKPYVPRTPFQNNGQIKQYDTASLGSHPSYLIQKGFSPKMYWQPAHRQYLGNMRVVRPSAYGLTYSRQRGINPYLRGAGHRMGPWGTRMTSSRYLQRANSAGLLPGRYPMPAGRVKIQGKLQGPGLAPGLASPVHPGQRPAIQSARLPGVLHPLQSSKFLPVKEPDMRVANQGLKVVPLHRQTPVIAKQTQKVQPDALKPKQPHLNKIVKLNTGGLVYQGGSGSGQIPLSFHHPKEPKPINPKDATYGIRDKCISLKFYNKLRKPVKIISSMKMAGYLVTAETFKLKTIFKHARRDRKVIFYAQDPADKEDVLLNNNNVVTIIPGPCDLPYKNLFLSRHGQFSNQVIEDYLKAVDHTSKGNATSNLATNPQSGFGQWSTFGPCSTSCGTGAQTRTRACVPGRSCLGPTMESRACIQPPCSKPNCVQTYGGNVVPGKCCSLPFIYQDTVYDKCITHAQTGGLWCSTSPNYDVDRSWGFCQQTERRSNTFYRPPGYSPAPVSRLHYRMLANGCHASCYNMCIPGCHVSCCSAHALAFPSVSKPKHVVKTSKHV